jgi:asparagine synthase (glutamine-hydrolysing)
MCGIVCAFDLKQNSETLRPQVLEMSKIIRHRGPDWSGIFSNDKAILSHERLAIVDPASGKQPLFSADGKLVLLLAKSIIIEIYANSLQVNIAFKQKVIAE